MSETQFHHYIPQFILKNFSHRFQPSSSSPKSASARKKRHKRNRINPGDPVLHVINLNNETPQRCESSVKRTFGLMDMYRDVSNASDQNIIEKELSKLESRVSRIIAEIKKAFESSRDVFSMSRDQRDTLRKFLFVMKYRGPGFYQRFHGNKPGRYIADDADQLEKYMAENGYGKPVDVWIKSIATILDLQLDLQGHWKEKLLAEIYPDHALWFIMHMEGYHLAFCTPCEMNDEFLLTENCYNVHEGPTSTVLNLETEEHEVISWSSYHEFAPVTPRLILILRSNLLPNPEEDTDERIKASREKLLKLCLSHHGDPDTARSTLEDLPIRKPRNSYSQVLPQGIQLLQGENGTRRSDHRFIFPFFQISTNQVHRINCILLDNAPLTSVIAFKSELSLKRSLEYYLQLPAHCGYKVVHRPNDVKLTYLKKLEHIARSMGCDVVMAYKEFLGGEEMEEARQQSLRQLQDAFLKDVRKQPTDFMQLYQELGM